MNFHVLFTFAVFLSPLRRDLASFEENPVLIGSEWPENFHIFRLTVAFFLSDSFHALLY